MRISSAAAHNRWHPAIEPVARVAPGDEVVFETRDGLDGQLTRESRHEDCATLDLGLGHPLTGPVFVEGAEPGDVLEVELLAYETPAFGVNCVIPGFGFLADVFTEPFLVRWELDGALARSDELPGVAVPACVHAGVVGVAPSAELMECNGVARRRSGQRRAGRRRRARDGAPPLAASGLRTIPPRENGGNLDIRRLVAGATLLLPVHVPGRSCRSATSISRRATARCAARASRSGRRAGTGRASRVRRSGRRASPPI